MNLHYRRKAVSVPGAVCARNTNELGLVHYQLTGGRPTRHRHDIITTPNTPRCHQYGITASPHDGTHPVGSLYTYDEIHLRDGKGIAQKERLVHSPISMTAASVAARRTSRARPWRRYLQCYTPANSAQPPPRRHRCRDHPRCAHRSSCRNRTASERFRG